jgi:hypothetical protein
MRSPKLVDTQAPIHPPLAVDFHGNSIQQLARKVETMGQLGGKSQEQ